MVTWFYTAISNVQRFQAPYIIAYIAILILAILLGTWWYFIVVWICILWEQIILNIFHALIE
jgi:hypothetical protein